MKENEKTKLEKKMIGCILGSMIGDAIGARFEGHPYYNFPIELLDSLLDDPKLIVGKYTDDTQMMKGILESLLKNQGLNEEDMANTFVKNFDIYRGYGIGTTRVLEAIRKGADWNGVAKLSFGGQGSYGNGAAMRICPVGLLYYFNINKLSEIAKFSSVITHTHEDAIEGAILQAQAVALALKEELDNFSPKKFLKELMKITYSSQYEKKLNTINTMLNSSPTDIEVINKLGNKISAIESVPTAIYLFLKYYESGFKIIIKNAIKLGGDTDTIACMAGAIAGAFFGIDKIPKNWVQTVEENDFFIQSSKQLFLLSQKMQSNMRSKIQNS